MQGPVELDALVPYVQAAFDRSGIGLGVTISGVRFGIDGRTRELRLSARDAQVTLPNGERVATFPEMRTSFSVASLLKGEIVPTQVSVERPILHLKRHEGGGFTFRVGNPEEGAPDLGPHILDDLVAAGPPDGQLGSLRRVRLHDATVIVDDKVANRRWRATHVDAAVERQRGAVTGNVSLAVALGDSAAELQADFNYEPVQRKADVLFKVNGLDPAALAPLIPELRPLSRIHTAVSGTLKTRLDLAGGVSEKITIDLGLGPGRLEYPVFAGGRLELSQGELHAVYTPENSELRLAALKLDLGGGVILGGDGTIRGVTPPVLAGRETPPASLPGNLNVSLLHVPASRVDKLWPAGLSPGGRRWVIANVPEGVLDEAAAQLSVTINPADMQANVVSARGTLRYHDVTVSYFNGLVPARKVSGTATLVDRRLEFNPASGLVKDIKLTGGSLVVSEIGAPIEWLTADVTISGPLQQGLEVIDAKPLHYAHAVGLDPARVGGKADAQIHFKLPLLADVKVDAIDYGVKGTLSGVSINKALIDRDFTDGNLAVDITKPGLKVRGNARFDGLPLTLDGEFPFHATATVRPRYHVATRLDDEGRHRLGLDFAPQQLSGPVGIDVVYSAGDNGRGDAAATLDLREANLSIPEAGWKKPAAAPATAKLNFDVENGAIVRLPNVELRAGGLDGRFAMVLTPDHRQIDRVEIKRFALAENEVTGTVMRRPGGGWRADLRGSRLDVSRLLKQDTGPTVPDSPPLAITGRFDRVLLSPHAEARGVTVQMLRTAGEWQAARIDARLPNGRRLTAQLSAGGPASDARRLILESEDFGATLSLFGVADNVVGGQLVVDGQVSESGGKRTIRGRVEATNYSVVRAPAFAQVLGMASLNGLAGALSGTGVPFTTLRADFTYGQDRVTLGRLVAYGASIGLTANGWLDLNRDWLELQGTLAPAYALNSFPGNVPVIGTLLTGGEGQGLFAANYRLSGAMDNPQVMVNPISAIAPGFLRKLFEFGLPQQPQSLSFGQPGPSRQSAGQTGSSQAQ